MTSLTSLGHTQSYSDWEDSYNNKPHLHFRMPAATLATTSRGYCGFSGPIKHHHFKRKTFSQELLISLLFFTVSHCKFGNNQLQDFNKTGIHWSMPTANRYIKGHQVKIYTQLQVLWDLPTFLLKKKNGRCLKCKYVSPCFINDYKYPMFHQYHGYLWRHHVITHVHECLCLTCTLLIVYNIVTSICYPFPNIQVHAHIYAAHRQLGLNNRKKNKILQYSLH